MPSALIVPAALVVGFAALFPCIPTGVVSSSDDANQVPSRRHSEEPNISDALYQIAQILSNNQNHSNLYEKIALLEASVTLSHHQNILVEMRLKELDDKVLKMIHKVSALSEVLTRAEALEISTKSLMENFEEKLSTLAAEILRLKNMAADFPDESLMSSGQKRDNFLQEDTREVESFDQSATMGTHLDKSMKSNSKFLGLREICLTSTSDPLVAQRAQRAQNCWFTFEENLVNWTTALKFCRTHGGILVAADNYAFTKANFTKGNVQTFWVSEAPRRNWYKSENPSVDQINSDNNLNSDSISADVNEGGQGETQQYGALLKTYQKNKPSGLIDIRIFPNSQEREENIEKNVYVSNVLIRHDGSHASKNRVSKRDSDDSVSLAMPKDAVRFNEFLLLQNEEDSQEVNSESGQIMSDSETSNILPLLRGTLSIRDSGTPPFDNSEKSCPVMICSGETECVIGVDDCSTLKAFWCQR